LLIGAARAWWCGRIVPEWAMLVPACIVLFIAVFAFCCCSLILVQKKNKRYIPPQPQLSGFNMEPCLACGGKRPPAHRNRRQKNVAFKKSSRSQLQSCVEFRPPHPHKERKTPYAPKRRLRFWKVLTALNKSIRRKSGQ
jgi:hypothetical protein